MELRIDDTIIRPSEHSTGFDMVREVKIQTGDNKGTNRYIPIGYDMRLPRLIEILLKEQIISDSEFSSLNDFIEDQKRCIAELSEKLDLLIKKQD